MPAHQRTAPAEPVAPPIRFADRRLRDDADRALDMAAHLIAGASLAKEGVHAADTPEHARRLAEMCEAIMPHMVKARRLFLERAEAR